MHGTKVSAVLAALLLVTAGAVAARPAAEAQALSAAEVAMRQAAKPAVGGAVPRPAGPNPYLALLPPGARPDYAAWQAYLADQARRGELGLRAVGDAPVVVEEREDPDERGGNDDPADAEAVDGFGTGADEGRAGLLTGTLGPLPETTTGPVGVEDDGAIPLATPVTLAPGELVGVMGEVGDGPHGSAGDATGDIDFYALPRLTAGQRLLADIDTDQEPPPPPAPGEGPPPFDGLDSTLTLFDADGLIVALNDDNLTSAPESFVFDALLRATIPADGDYFLAVGSFLSEFPQDPFDSSTAFGVVTEGPYDLGLGLDVEDVDRFAVELEAGDVVGAAVDGGGTLLELTDEDGAVLTASGVDASVIAPAVTGLPGGGNAVLSRVVEADGTYTLGVSGGNDAPYATRLLVERPGLQRRVDDARQVLFLDFDGEAVQTAQLGGAGVRTLSPLASFLPRWGLGPQDEDAVIAAITARVEEVYLEQVAQGGNGARAAGDPPGAYDLEIRTSRDASDPFGQPDVSRVVIGGTIEEATIPTIGIAESIDLGNRDTSETALVLLDLLSEPVDPSAPPPDPEVDGFPLSLNAYGLAPGTTIVDLIGEAVGAIVAHEAGHFFGNFHTDNRNEVVNIQDAGGNPPQIFGVGPDLVFGTADDVSATFGPDAYDPFEGFSGVEDTLETISYGLSTPDGSRSVVRAGGADRIATAAEVSRTTFAAASTVVLARADQYADALAGGPLAARLEAPLLLTGNAALSEPAAAEIARLGATDAVLLGGEAALGRAVADDLFDLGLDVARLSGPDRFATAAQVAAVLGPFETAVLAEGFDPDPTRGFPDALSAGGLAATLGLPVLLTTTEQLPPATADALGDADVLVIGGPAAISDDVLDAVEAAAGAATRVAGVDRYATSAAVADVAVANGADPAVTWLATGTNFPDGLAAGAATGAAGGVLLLVDGTDLDRSPATRDWLIDNGTRIDRAFLAGGATSLAEVVDRDLRPILEQ